MTNTSSPLSAKPNEESSRPTMPPKSAAPNAREWIFPALAFLFSLLLFLPSLRYDFVGLDDDAYVSENPMVLNGFSWAAIKEACSARIVGHWAPILWLSFMLDSTLFGTAPWGFHLTNILLHAINAALVFLLLRSWTGRNWAALWGALFWALHPLRVESVAWITERKDVLSGFFFLLCVLTYTRATRDGTSPWRRVGIPTLLLGAGLLVKPVLLTAPFVLLLLDLWPLQRWTPTRPRALLPLLVEKWPLWLVTLALGVGIWVSYTSSGIITDTAPAIGNRLLLVPASYLTYARQIFWPHSHSVLHPRPEFFAETFIAAIALLLCVTVAICLARSRRLPLLTGWLWFLGMLVPAAGIVWAGAAQGAGDRFTYLPAIGISLLIILLANPRAKSAKWTLAFIGIASLCAAAGLSLRQLPVWTNEGTLFKNVLSIYPSDLQAHLNYGLWLQRHGDADGARRHIAQALAQSPQAAKAIEDQAYEWALRGRPSDAITLLDAVLSEPQATSLMFGSRGIANLAQGDAAKAIADLNKALEMAPRDEELRIELVRANFEAGDTESARQNAAKLTKWPGPPLNNYAALFGFYTHRWEIGESAYAWTYFERLADSLAKGGDASGAQRALEAARQLAQKFGNRELLPAITAKLDRLNHRAAN